MSEPQIGQWVKREGAFRRREDGTWTGPRWHLVESDIADRAVVRCGKQMRHTTTRGELQVSGVMPLTRAIGQPQLCKRCHQVLGEEAWPGGPDVGRVLTAVAMMDGPEDDALSDSSSGAGPAQSGPVAKPGDPAGSAAPAEAVEVPDVWRDQVSEDDASTPTEFVDVP